MKIYYMSDLHFDFYINYSNKESKNKKYLDNYLQLTGVSKIPEDERNILIIPGDISNTNKEAMFLLKELKKLFKEIIIVTGNHDLYLHSSSQAHKYKNISWNRVKEMKEFCLQQNIHLLDGEVIKINDISFGGLGMTWDTSYYGFLTRSKPNNSEVLSFFRSYMNDSEYILDGFKPYKVPLAYNGYDIVSSWNPLKYFEKEYIKLKEIPKVDVMITHYSPVIPENIPLKYADDKGSTFYMFDGSEEVKRIQPKFWLFGHMHNKYDFSKDGVRFLCNPIGYPGETSYKVDYFEI